MQHQLSNTLTATTLALLMLFLTPLAHAAKKECGLSFIGKTTGLFNRGLNQKKINNLVLDRYTEEETIKRNKILKDIAQKTEALEQALTRSIITPAPVTLRHLRKITNKILQQWPYESPDVDIHITSLTAYGPRITKNLTILLPIGFIEMAESDDELAFILAHELAHALLGHTTLVEGTTAAKHNLRMIKRAGDASTLIAKNMISLSEGASSKETQEAEKINQQIFYYYNRFRRLMVDVIHPSWQKPHEDEADLLAMELYLKAGYALEGHQNALLRLEETENAACEMLTDFTQNMKKFFSEDIEATAKNMMESGEVDTDSLTNQFKKFSTSKLESLLVQQAVPKTHRPYDKRKAYLTKYIDRPAMEDLVDESEERDTTATVLNTIRQSKEYRTLLKSAKAVIAVEKAIEQDDLALASKKIKSVSMRYQGGRLLKHNLRLKQQKKSKAIDNINLAIREKIPSLEIFQKYAQYKFEAGELNAAKKQITRATKLFNDEYHFMPELIYFYAQKDKTKAKQHLDKCLKSNRDLIEGPCYAAYLGKRADFRDSHRQILDAINCEGDDKGNDVKCNDTDSNPLKGIKNIFAKMKE